MRSDDLVPVLADPRSTALGFRQGVIVSWDPNTAANQVLVGTSLMTNLPILNTSEAAILAAGDVVGILTAGKTWGILGRFTIPETPEAVTSLSSLRTASADVLTVETATVASYTDLTTVGPAVTISVGPSGRVLVIASAEMRVQAPKGSVINTGGAGMGYAATGANTFAALDRYATIAEIAYDSTPTFTSDLLLRTAMSRATLRTGLTPGSTTFTAKYNKMASGTTTFSNRNITVMAL